MPRRPRPSYRTPPRGSDAVSQTKKIQSNKLKKTRDHQPVRSIEDFHQEENQLESVESVSEGSIGSYFEEEVDSAEEDADAPRISQWVDGNELEESSGEESEEEEEEKPEAGPSQLRKIQSNLSSLPFGTLRNAQYALSHAEVATDSELDGGHNDGSMSGSEEVPAVQSSKDQLVEWSTKPRKDIAKRANKHAPTEVTSKRPVTRFRHVVEVKKIEARDPRFLPTAGEFKSEKYQQNYQFLAEVHTDEVKALRDSLRRARKMLDNAPRHLREDYEAEVGRLELAMKRAESIVNKERMDKIQRETLMKISKDEKEKRKQGKGDWFLKKSDERELLTRVRYEALAAEGGNRAVKKAIAKRQKKISQKEKKSRPFPKGGPSSKGPRKRSAGSENDVRKRRRVG